MTTLQSVAIAAAPAATPAPDAFQQQVAESDDGGLFLPATGRLVDTRNNTGLNFNGQPMPGATWHAVAPLGKNGVPTSGVSAVQVTLSVVNPTTNGASQVRASGGTNPGTTSLYYAVGASGSQTNTTIIPLGADGKFEIRADTSVHMVMDVEGYFTDGDTAAGGYVPMRPSARVVDTRNGSGLPQAKLTSGSTTTIDIAALTTTMPANASAVFLNFEVLNSTSTAGNIQPYAAHKSVTGAPSLTFPASVTTSVSATVQLGSGGSNAGKIKLFLQGSGAGGVDLLVNVVGYYTAAGAPGQTGYSSAFNPSAERVVDEVTIAANSTSEFEMANKAGMPKVSWGLSAVVLNMQVHQQNANGSGGNVGAWPGLQDNPGTSVLNYQPNILRSNLTTVAIGGDGKIRVRNSGNSSIKIWLDLQGWYELPAALHSNAGNRPGATNLDFTAGDSVQARVDVATGNLNVAVNGFSLPAVQGSVAMSASYNSLTSSTYDIRRLGRGWVLENTPDIRLTAAPGNPADADVILTAPSGRVERFFPTSQSNGVVIYHRSAGLKAELKRQTDGTYDLRMLENETVYYFAADGALTKTEDRNDNPMTVAQSGTGTFRDLTITSSAGNANANRARVSTNSSGTTTILHGNTTTLREISFARSNDVATSFTDALGRTTTFSYGTGDQVGLLTQISAPGNVVTQFTYDVERRVTAITQVENASGGPGNSVTRLAYAIGITQVAAPDTDQSKPVGSVERTGYEINDDYLVDKAVDAASREESETYTPNFDTATSTIGATGGSTGDSTTTNTWGANGGDSLTSSQQAGGATTSWGYGGSAGALYNPTTSTDDAGRESEYSYNGVGNQLTSKNGDGAQAEVERNDDGTVSAATSPGNGSNDTTYAYTNGQLVGMTPVTGTSLGQRAFTYDALGRRASQTNGRGVTTTWTYDLKDRVTQVTHTGPGSSSTSVTYAFDTAGRMNSRVDVNGTTTTTYDQLGRMLTRENTAGGGVLTYRYDKASRLISTTSTVAGTINYAYDASGVAIGYNYPVTAGSSTRTNVRFTIDTKGRRTGTYVNPNNTRVPTTWSARQLMSYDESGRVTGVIATRANGTADVVNVTYCYAAGTTPAGGCEKNEDNDRAKLVWQKDNITGNTVEYTYDLAGRLINANASSTTDYSYGYNLAGARTSATAGSTTQTLSFNAAHQITTTGFGYDGAGNLTADPVAGVTNVTYTGADQLNSVNKAGTTYTYKHAGEDNNELLEQTTPDGTYRYTYGRNTQAGVPIVEQVQRTYSTNGNTTTDAAAVISDPITGQPLMLKTSDGANSLYIYDGTPGAPIALINDQGSSTAAYAYDPYGAATTNPNPNPAVAAQNPYTFAGNGVRDRTTGWIHYGQRYYSARTGTFTQQDTLDAPLSPLNGNRYAYAGGDPINNVDPTGLATNCRGATAVGAFGGAILGGAIGSLPAPGAGTAKGAFAGATIGAGFANKACNSDSDTALGRTADGLKGAADAVYDQYIDRGLPGVDFKPSDLF